MIGWAVLTPEIVIQRNAWFLIGFVAPASIPPRSPNHDSETRFDGCGRVFLGTRRGGKVTTDENERRHFKPGRLASTYSDSTSRFGQSTRS